MERPLSPFAAGSSTIYGTPLGQDPNFADLELMTGHVPLEPACDRMVPGSTVMGESEGADSEPSGRLAAPLGSRQILGHDLGPHTAGGSSYDDSPGTEALRSGMNAFLKEEEREAEHAGTDEHIGWNRMVKKLENEGHSKESSEKIAGYINKEKNG